MIRETAKAEHESYDVLVVGGGIFGACAAYEAASRGLRVVLVERADFAGATTANSYKIVHGGIRYLQHGDVGRVRESSRERSALLRTAPHLVRPMPILIPTYGRGMKGKAVLRAGFKLYEWLTADRNRGIADPSRRIPAARARSRAETLARFPGLPDDRLTGGIVFCDGQMYSPPRIALAYLRSAAEAGATLLNYAEVTGLDVEEGRVRGAVVHDRLTDRRKTVRADVVLNATGPWTGRLLDEALDLDLGPERPVFSRDVGLVTRRKLAGEMGLACPTTTRDAEALVDRGGRHLFLLPWRDTTLVGVWHGVWSGSPDRVTVKAEELADYVDEANRAYPGLDLRTQDVVMVNTGLILYGAEDETSREHHFGHESLLFDHAERHGVEGIVTLVGVRATMARGVAERAIDLVFRKLGRPAIASDTDTAPIWGGDVDDFDALVRRIGDTETGGMRLPGGVARQLAHNHGSRYVEVLEPARERPDLATPYPGTTVLPAQVVHAVRREMAITLEDVLTRRTDLGTAAAPTAPVLDAVASDMASEAEWDEARTRAEIAGAREFFAQRGAVRAFDGRPPATETGGAVSVGTTTGEGPA
ncbi:MAG: FAD-dependent oxidoreductase [Gemmatimonadota bacterium]